MRIVFPVKVYQKLRAYVLCSPHEISGLGKVRRVGDNLIIEEVRIFNQVVSGVETVLDKKALGEFFDAIIAEGGNLADWSLWWHSHCNFSAYFSTIDTTTIEDFDNDMKEDNWMLSLVTNHEGKIVTRIDVFAPFRYTIKDIPYDIAVEDEQTELETLSEIQEKVITNPITILRGNRMRWSPPPFYNPLDVINLLPAPNGKGKRKARIT